MTGDEALAALEAQGNPERAAGMAAYHKVARRYLGTPGPAMEALDDLWRATATLDERLALASALWDSDVHEARVAAAKLLTQARIRPGDEGAWRLVASWVPDFDTRVIADQAAKAGERRLVADPRRLDEVEGWVLSPHPWTRRAALMMTLPWTRDRFAKPAELEVRERILGWCESLTSDPDADIQRAIAGWLRDLSKRDPDRVHAWLEAHGPRLRPLARKEAAQLLS